MISMFLPLVVLAYATVQFEGMLAEFPLTSLVAWLYFTAVVVAWFLPATTARLNREGIVPGFMTVISGFHWATVAWVVVLQVFVSPARFLGGLFRFFPQAFPVLLSAVVYVSLFWVCRRFLHGSLRFMIDPDQTPTDFFRARMTIPILFFPPMMIWIALEDLATANLTPSGFSDVHAFVFAPMFFVGLYLMAPRLFNLAWRASPMDNERLVKDIDNLACLAETPISGVKLWDTFKEPIPNAAVAGLSEKFRFVYMTRYLTEIFTHSELLAVVAHELGHLRLGHVWTYLLFSLDLIFLSLLLKLYLFVDHPGYYEMLNGYEPVIDVGFFVIIFALVFTALTRYSEHQSDCFSAGMVGSEKIADTLVKLEDYISPPPTIFPRWTLTHPDFKDRLSVIRNWSGTVSDLVRQSRNIRLLMIVAGVILIALSFTRADFMIKTNNVERLLASGKPAEALVVLDELSQNHTGHYYLDDLFIRCAWSSGDYVEAVASRILSEFGSLNQRTRKVISISAPRRFKLPVLFTLKLSQALLPPLCPLGSDL
jgi:Zn-dependent protease with chaperone function